MDNPVEPAGGGPYDPSLGQRVSRLEGEVQDLKVAVARVEQIVTRIEASLPHVATKVEVMAGQADMKVAVAVADLRADMKAGFGSVRADLAEKPSRTYMWGILGVLLTAYACGLAALAVLK